MNQFNIAMRGAARLHALLLIGIFGIPGLVPAASAQLASDSQTSLSATAECRFTPYIPRAQHYESLVSESDPFLGDFNAPVTVVEFFDPNCGHCRTLHPVMERVIATYEDRARFFMVPLVSWPYSLGQIEALYVAAAKGKYYEMLDAQFENQKSGGLSIEELRDLASEIDIDPDWLEERVAEGRHQSEIVDRRRQILGLGVTDTPTIMINGRFITDSDSKTVECIGQLIEEALVSGN